VGGVRLRIVQANIDPGKKGDDSLSDSIVRDYIKLTRNETGLDSVTHVVWPETATPYPFDRYQQALADATPRNGLLVSGAVRAQLHEGLPPDVWNSLVAVGPDGTIVGTYDKFHLVPFGEYVPLHDVLPFISKFTPGILDFTAGPGPRTLRLPGLPPVGPLICYEIIFPGQVVDAEDRPAWILNLTNDGWYGISSGPYQHFVSARLRAVEEGVPVVRAANTGISGVIDAYGRVLSQTALGETEVLDADLPRPLADLTPYARFGDKAAAIHTCFGVSFETQARRQFSC
jgi:apolipoprotein N-acyltransferase